MAQDRASGTKNGLLYSNLLLAWVETAHSPTLNPKLYSWAFQVGILTDGADICKGFGLTRNCNPFTSFTRPATTEVQD